jgi:D-alanyl-D-alanine carboxypeptidase (penicillin-binding protein 5/6)
MGGLQIWLESGEQMSVRDLLKATCVSSANDAAVCAGRICVGQREAFVEL